jgi:alanine racemase
MRCDTAPVAPPMTDMPLPRTAWMEVDLDAIRENFVVLQGLAGASTPLHPVVKANAYGHGAVRVALTLAAAGANGFCVATYDEALLLRRAGIREQILVLYPIPPELGPSAARMAIDVTAGDATLLMELESALRGANLDGHLRLRVQLEVETGLGRGGFLGGVPLRRVAGVISNDDRFVFAGIWTHLQAPEDQALTDRQLLRFEQAAQDLQRSGFRLPGRHVAATGGLLLGEAPGMDGVRPGLAIYGLMPDDLRNVAAQATLAAAASLRPAMSIHARPVRVAELPRGWGIGYGPTFTTSRASRIATLPIGYADGWSRALSNRAFGLVRGRRVPLVGSVAMDAVMADVTDIPGIPVTAHDEFVLLGEQGREKITAGELAVARGTNSWEVVTGFSARLPRIYHDAQDLA